MWVFGAKKIWYWKDWYPKRSFWYWRMRKSTPKRSRSFLRRSKKGVKTRWGNLGRRRPAIIDNSRPWGLVLSAILGTDREHFVFEKLYSFHCENLNKTKLRQLKMYETNTWIVNHNKNIYEIYLSIMKYIIKKLKYQSNIRKMSVTIIILKLLLLMFKWHDFDNQFG